MTRRSDPPFSLLGIDLGTSSVKTALARAEDGRFHKLGASRAAYPLLGTEHGFAEQSPEDWTRALAEALRSLSNEVSPGEMKKIGAIALSAQMPTMVVVNEAGQTLGNAILWRDARAEPQAKALLAGWGEKRHYDETGVVLDARYILPMYEWLVENGRIHARQVKWVLSAKDYIHLWLTGTHATDPSTASGFGVYSLRKGAWDAALCREAGFDIEKLPRIRNSQEVTGHLLPPVAEATGLPPGIPVIVGAADSMAGLVGAGALEEGAICQVCGSSTAIVAVTKEIMLSDENKYFVTPLAKPGTWGMEADILSSGSAVEWLLKVLGEAARCITGDASGMTPAMLSRIARHSPPGCAGVKFFPYLAGGEQGVLWDRELVGGILGFSNGHGLSDIARALYEGLCYEARRCVEAFEAAGYRTHRLICTGLTAQDPFYMQMMSDVMGIDGAASTEENASAMGAAYIAGVGMGMTAWDEIPRLASGENMVYRPQAARTKIYEEFYHAYLTASRHSRIWKEGAIDATG